MQVIQNALRNKLLANNLLRNYKNLTVVNDCKIYMNIYERASVRVNEDIVRVRPPHSELALLRTHYHKTYPRTRCHHYSLSLFLSVPYCPLLLVRRSRHTICSLLANDKQKLFPSARNNQIFIIVGIGIPIKQIQLCILWLWIKINYKSTVLNSKLFFIAWRFIPYIAG